MAKTRKLETPVRVQIPVYTDWWMRGARYGEIIKVTDVRRLEPHSDIAHVRLDANGKVIKVWLDDCNPV